MIVGQPGSGKSTFARLLGDATELPVIHIDRIHWQPGWVERPRPAKLAMIRAEEVKERWIIEGGLSETWEERRDRADLLIWLDVPMWRRLARVVRRRMTYHQQTRPDLPENCPERLDPEFLRWIWNTRRTARERMRRLFETAGPNTRAVVLHTLSDVRAFVNEVRSTR